MFFLCIAASASAQTLRGSPASVDLMYTSAHEKDLAFLHTRDDIYRSAVAGDLKLLLITNDVALDRVRYPFVLPFTRRFVDSLAAAYHRVCGERLVVTSGARPISEQPRNASPKSVHPTGMAVDFRKPRNNPACLEWLRAGLLALENRRVIEATEERYPPHFHVAVLWEMPMTPAVIASVAPPVRTPMPATTIAAAAAAKTAMAHGEVGPPLGTSSTANGSGSKTYQVRAGDNLWTIARRNGTTSKQIQELNGLGTTRLRVGQVLKLP